MCEASADASLEGECEVRNWSQRSVLVGRGIGSKWPRVPPFIDDRVRCVEISLYIC